MLQLCFLVWHCRRVKVRMKVLALTKEMMKRMLMKRNQHLMPNQFPLSWSRHHLNLPRILRDNCLKRSWRRRSWLSWMPCWLNLVFLGTTPRMKKVIHLMYAFSFVARSSCLVFLCLWIKCGGSHLFGARTGKTRYQLPSGSSWQKMMVYETWIWFVHMFL